MEESKDKYLVIKGKTDSSIWGVIKDSAKGDAKERTKAVDLIFDNYRVIPDKADELLLGLAGPENSVQVRRAIAKRLAQRTGIPWAFHVKVTEVLSKDRDNKVQEIVKPIIEPYQKMNDYFSQLVKAWTVGLTGWVEVFRSLMPPELDRALTMIGKEPQSGTIEKSIRNMQTITRYFEPDLILPIAERLDSARLPDINRIYSDRVMSISNNFAKDSLQFLQSYSYFQREPKSEEIEVQENPLISKLRSIPSGIKNWHDYQEVCQEIMDYCFVPPLLEPQVETKNQAGIHRRDMIYPIPGGVDSFWGFIQSAYSSTGVIVDAKNYGDELPQNEVVVVSKYFGRKKMGSFGIIMSRKGPSVSAQKEQVDKWVHDEEMIVCLSDKDVEEMVRLKDGNGEPWSILDKKSFEIRKSA